MGIEGTVLDVTKKQSVQYCIPTWLRDEQIKLALKREGVGRIQEGAKRDEPIALVSFGPSLLDTWEKIKDFKYVMSCSGAHKFLVDRGIIPTHHIDVDPREHKVTLMGQPQRETEYLIASTCHPALFNHLEGYNVKLWHIYDNTTTEIPVLPRGEWLVTGGCSVGVRTLTVAAFLGFRELHVFGMDGCAGPDEVSHAATHPNGIKKWSKTEYKGKTYFTTPGMLEAAKGTFHELNQMPGVKATFYGEGLVQEMAKDYEPAYVLDAEGKPVSAVLAAVAEPVISDDYRRLNEQLHNDNPLYGAGGAKHAPVVAKLVEKCGCKPVLDYGCGKGMLAKSLPFPIWEYDPAIPEHAASPRPADLVVCTDVLEHIEPETLRAVLRDLARCIQKVGYFTIHTGPARKTYADGRNTHLIQRDIVWWCAKLNAYFSIGSITQVGPELVVVVGPKVK